MSDASFPFAPAVALGSPARFGYEASHYPDMEPAYEEQFRRWTAALPRGAWQDARFLDVGCGMGRNSLWPIAYGARSGVAVDVDERSLRAARRTLAGFPVAVRQESIYDLDSNGAFDIAFAIGVLHHLSDPARALAALKGAVKPGGRVLVWVFGHEGNERIIRLLSPLRQALLSRLPIELLHHLSLYPAALLKGVVDCGLGETPYFRFLRRVSFHHLRSIVFDQMLPSIVHYWRRADVEALMRAAGLVNVELAWVNQRSWSAVGRRP